MKNDIYIDCEFSDFLGELISIALVRDRDDYLYLVRPVEDLRRMDAQDVISDWVQDNVIPILDDVPEEVTFRRPALSEWGFLISVFMSQVPGTPNIIADWPEDLWHFNRLLLLGGGQAVHMGPETQMTCLRHLHVYPTTLEGAVQHNAWWDALAIRAKVING